MFSPKTMPCVRIRRKSADVRPAQSVPRSQAWTEVLFRVRAIQGRMSRFSLPTHLWEFRCSDRRERIQKSTETPTGFHERTPTNPKDAATGQTPPPAPAPDQPHAV